MRHPGLTVPAPETPLGLAARTATTDHYAEEWAVLPTNVPGARGTIVPPSFEPDATATQARQAISR